MNLTLLHIYMYTCQEQKLYERVGPVQPTRALQGAEGEGGDRECGWHSQVHMHNEIIIDKITKLFKLNHLASGRGAVLNID